jgi:hypothetical protein
MENERKRMHVPALFGKTMSNPFGAEGISKTNAWAFAQSKKPLAGVA